ncbi:hypothetical protein [Paenibacillus sanguinis]|uniref:hypothetical protein n=1 Tax=Paenibacillus sanguinis TaxID=225906 RepID=UPI000369DB4B|nr:hypothetical protein [Paenibacillus sanguinis]
MIYIDDTGVKVGGVVLPGLFRSMEIKGEAKVEEQEVKGKTTKPKQATGYEDAKITLEIALEDSPNMTKLRRLETIQRLFQKPGQAKPIVHDFVSTHSSVRGVNKVILKSLTTREQNKKSEITVMIELWQYAASRITASKSSGKATAKKSASKSSSSIKLTEDFSRYLSDGNRGTAPKTSNKTSKTAAVDNKNTSVYKNGILRMPV